MIKGTTSTGTSIEGLRTVKTATRGSVTFTMPAASSGTITTTSSSISAGLFIVTSATSTGNTAIFVIATVVEAPFVEGDYVNVTGVTSVLSGTTNGYLNGRWLVSSSTPSSVTCIVPGAGTRTAGNAVGTIGLATPMTISTIVDHGMTQFDSVNLHGESTSVGFSNAQVINTAIPSANIYTIMSTPTTNTFTIYPSIYYFSQNSQFSSVGRVISSNAHIQALNYPYTGCCLENITPGTLLNSTNTATVIAVTHYDQGPNRAGHSAQNQPSIFATATTLNATSGRTATNLAGTDFTVQPSLSGGRPTMNILRNNNIYSQAYITDYTSAESGFRILTSSLNLSNSQSNDVPSQVGLMGYNGARYEREFNSGTVISAGVGNVGSVAIGTTFLITNAVVTGSGPFITTFTITAVLSYTIPNGTSIVVSGVLPATFNQTYTVTTPTNNTTVTVSTASSPGTYLSGGVISLANATNLSTGHIRLGADTGANNSYLWTYEAVGGFLLSSFYYEGGLGDVFAFNRILTTEERQLLEGYLANKYRINNLLGAGSTAPSVATNVNQTITSLGTITGSGPFVVPVNFSNTITFANKTQVTIAGCTPSGYNATWAVTATAAGTATINTPTNLGALTTAGTIRGTTTANTFVHPYRLNPTTIIPSNTLDLTSSTSTYAQNLVAWFDANNAPSIAFSSGVIVSEWSSTMGALPVTLTPNGSAAPTRVQNAQNGLPGIRFAITGSNGTPLGMATSATSMAKFSTINTNNEYTIITVYKQPTHGSSRIISNILGATSDPRLAAYTNVFSYQTAGGTQQVKNYIANTSGKTYITAHYRRGNVLSTRVNGVLDNASASTPENLNIIGTNFGIHLGGYSRGNISDSPFAGDIYEHIIFRSALTDQEIQHIEGYLSWKWGVRTDSPLSTTFVKSYLDGLGTLALWLDASILTGTEGSNVSAWTNSAGTDVAQTGSSNLPTLALNRINGRNAVQFDGTSQFVELNNIASLPTGNTSCTVFIVASTPSAKTLPQVLFQYGGSSGPSGVGSRQMYIAGNVTPENIFLFADVQSGAARARDEVAASQPFVMSVTYTTAAGTGALTNYTTNAWRNGTAFTNIVDPIDHTTTGTQIGYLGMGFNGTAKSWYLNGFICEVLVYSGVLNTANRQLVESYLAWKWRAQGTSPGSVDLPTNHSYYSASP